MQARKIQHALISVYSKEGLEPIVHELVRQNVQLISTGGTEKFIRELGYSVKPVEDLTGFPSIFGGRVKTLHPAIFGGILYNRSLEEHRREAASYQIAPVDLVIVDLYPFEETVRGGGSEEEVIEKIDIGGIALIRGAAKNFEDVLVISHRDQYEELLHLVKENQCTSHRAERRKFAGRAFDISSHYDTMIFNYFSSPEDRSVFKKSIRQAYPLRYGENPHQSSVFYGALHECFDQLNGKELSYNNLVDIDSAAALIDEFTGDTAFAIIKHTNACGVATGRNVHEAYLKALAADPVSAFGGILISNTAVNMEAAQEIHKLFFEILLAPAYDQDALELITAKKNRIVLRRKNAFQQARSFKSLLNGVIEQDSDSYVDDWSAFTVATKRKPTQEEQHAMLFANKVCKHTKSNAIVLASGNQMLASGVGQTSRVDALKQAIEKANAFNLRLEGSAMASDAFFPFPDCVEIAHTHGIKAVIQPGGSVKDQESIDVCDAHDMTMVLTGVRHFKH